MIGLPFLGCGDILALIEENVGEVSMDEEGRRECLDHMNEIWNMKICERHAE
jgi:hypothetical protein